MNTFFYFWLRLSVVSIFINFRISLKWSSHSLWLMVSLAITMRKIGIFVNYNLFINTFNYRYWQIVSFNYGFFVNISLNYKSSK